jgi:drug/metabolite transporter (DMT)-like permease
MSSLALAIVLCSALLHATWNALVKSAGDRAVTLAGVAASHALGGIVLIAISDAPERASWWTIGLSTLVHYLYYYLLFIAYRLGDLSQIYPISRGMAPALVALGALVILGENLSLVGWSGLFAISCGILLLAFQGGSHAPARGAVLAAVMLGFTIASYSVLDGIGIRWSQSPTGYMGWLFLLEAPVVLAVLASRVKRKVSIDPRAFIRGLMGGLMAVTAYGMVLYANTLAPLGAVSAVRESSVVIAALIGVLLLGERPWKMRILAAFIVAGGVVALAAT